MIIILDVAYKNLIVKNILKRDSKMAARGRKQKASLL
jgi:hypothetical protein